MPNKVNLHSIYKVIPKEGSSTLGLITPRYTPTQLNSMGLFNAPSAPPPMTSLGFGIGSGYTGGGSTGVDNQLQNVIAEVGQGADFYVQWIKHHNPKLPQEHVVLIANTAVAACNKNNVMPIPPDPFMGMMTAESGFRPNATSKAGAGGLCQIMPGTFKGLGYSGSLYDIVNNIKAGADYFATALKNYGWRGGAVSRETLGLVVAMYNGGPGGAEYHIKTGKWYKGTYNYFMNVLAFTIQIQNRKL